MSEIEPGTVVGGVRVDAVIGRGGMGVVYRGHQLALNRTVAVKVVRADLAESAEFRRRFTQECEIAASLDHPHIVGVHAAGEDGGRLFVTMRHVDGTDLREMVDERGRLDPAFAADVVSQIGDALDAAHRRGLVHRDVKSANILVTTADGRPHAYLTDFGLSRAIAAESGFTRTGTAIGSIDYMAPEQFEGGPLDGRVDVYALGCVLYQALSGQVPFPRDTEPAKIWAHMQQDPPPLPAVAPGVPVGLDAVVRRAMAKRPADRFATAGELGRAAVAAVQRAEPIPSPVVTGSAGRAGETVAVAPPVELAGARSAQSPSPPAPTAPPGASGPVPEPPLFGPVPPRTGAVPVTPAPAPAPTGGPARPSRRRRYAVLGLAVAVVAVGATAAAVASLPRGEAPPPPAAAAPAPPAAAGEVIGEPIAVGREPIDIDAGEGFLWSANASDGTISRIDPAAGTSEQIDVGGSPDELAVDEGAVWVRTSRDSITRVDVASGEVDEPIDVGRQIDGIATGGGFLWLSHAANDTVSRIDMGTGEVEGGPIRVGAEPVDLAWGDRRLGERRLYVADTGDRTLTTVDGAAGEVLGEPLPLPGEPGAVEVFDGVIYVGTPAGVVPVDERSRVVGDPIPLKGGSLFAPDAEGVWVAFPLRDELRRFDVRGGETRGTAVAGVGRGLGDMVLVDGVLWVTDSDEGTVTRIRVS